jgi:hypothetical protein
MATQPKNFVSWPLNFRSTMKTAIRSTKQSTTRSVYPGYNRPATNGAVTPANPDVNGNGSAGCPFPNTKNTIKTNRFIARPIKHWRKSLTPANSNKSRPTIGFIDRPGGLVFRGANCGCDSRPASKQNYIVEDITRPFLRECMPDVTVYNPGYKQIGTPGTPGAYQINTGVYEIKNLSINPRKRIVRSGSTNVSRAYHTNSASYLQARCRTYQQKQTFSKMTATPNQYVNANGIPVNPSNSATGSQVYYSTNCGNAERIYETVQDSRNCRETVIHKPNNKKYGVQGAVSAGTRLERLKLETITKNGASFMSAYGHAAANAGSYHGGSMGAPYFIKSKVFKPDCNLYNRAVKRPHLKC